MAFRKQCSLCLLLASFLLSGCQSPRGCPGGQCSSGACSGGSFGIQSHAASYPHNLPGQNVQSSTGNSNYPGESVVPYTGSTYQQSAPAPSKGGMHSGSGTR